MAKNFKLFKVEVSKSDSDNTLDCVYLKFKKTSKYKETKEIVEGVFIDLDINGKIIGIEFTNPEDQGMKA